MLPFSRKKVYGGEKGDEEQVRDNQNTGQASSLDLSLRSAKRRRAVILDEFKTWSIKLPFSFALGALVPILMYGLLYVTSLCLGKDEEILKQFLHVSHLIAISFFCAGLIPTFLWDVWDIFRIVFRGMKED